MIVSHRHKFIFLKTRKTAGTSVEIALSRVCGPDDIITPISPEDERLRAELGYPGPQNFLVPRSRQSRTELLVSLLKRRRMRFYNHMPAREVLERIGRETWTSYFKFTIERNPYDKVVSRFHWDHRKNATKDFSTFVRAGSVHLAGGFDIYSIDGRVAVDRILRFEDLDVQLREVGIALNLPGMMELPRTKASSRPSKSPYREYFGEEERRLVDVMFARELRLLGYTFDP